MTLREVDGWWVAEWFGIEVRDVTAVGALRRLGFRVRDARYGLGIVPGMETFDQLAAAWPKVRDAVAVLIGEVPEPMKPRPEAWLDDPGPKTLDEARAAVERRVAVRALELEGGNITRTAKRVGLSRFGCQKMLRRLGVEVRKVVEG